MQVIGIDVWDGSNSAIQNYAKGGSRNVTYPLGQNGSSVGSTWDIDRSSYAIVDATGKVAFITSNSVPYFSRYQTYKQAIIDKLTELTTTSSVEEPADNQPLGFDLAQNSPNPFTSSTSIRFTLNRSLNEQPRLLIYDMLGREVRSYEQFPASAGSHIVRWDGRDQAGSLVPQGIYFYVLKAGAEQSVKRLIFLGQ